MCAASLVPGTSVKGCGAVSAAPWPALLARGILGSLRQLGDVGVLLLAPARAARAVASAQQITNMDVALLRVHQIVPAPARFAIWIRLDGFCQRLPEGRRFDCFFVDHPFHFVFPAR
jgi:hypothetical protein